MQRKAQFFFVIPSVSIFGKAKDTIKRVQKKIIHCFFMLKIEFAFIICIRS